MSASRGNNRRMDTDAARSQKGNQEPSQEINYWDDEDSDSNFPYEDSRSDFYADSIRELPKDVIEWESYTTDSGTVQILLPPPSVKIPSTIIHFTGGTFFGSAPSVWYRQLLEDLVKHTQAAVVATSIPVTLFQSPLEHVALAKKIERQFLTAFDDILIDEYGEDVEKVPVCGMGHSLGARLLVVLSTLRSVGASSQTASLPTRYKAFVLISFTNYGAAAGIPGIDQLRRSSRQVELEINGKGKDEMSTAKARNGSGRGRKGAVDYGDDDDDNGEFDEDWGEILMSLKDMMREQGVQIRKVFTPASKELEFHPTPDQLWKALIYGKRYNVPHTLLVQFDSDEIDQSAKLANAIKEFSAVRFARIRGTHLSPVASQSVSRRDGEAILQQINSKLGRVLLKTLSGKRGARNNDAAAIELRQSIARFVIEIVTRSNN